MIEAEQVPLNKDSPLSCLKEAGNDEEKPKSMFQLLKGYLLIIAFSLVISMNGILLKMSFTLSGSDSSTIRYFLQLVTMFIIAKCKKTNTIGLSSSGVSFGIQYLINANIENLIQHSKNKFDTLSIEITGKEINYKHF